MRSRNWARTKNSNTEQELKRLICRWIQLHGGYVRMYPSFRGAMNKKTGKYVTYRSPFMPPGVPDLLVCWKGKFIGIEVKRPASTQITAFGAKKEDRGEPSPAQLFELELIRRSLGMTIIAYSLEDVIAILKPEALPPGWKGER